MNTDTQNQSYLTSRVWTSTDYFLCSYLMAKGGMRVAAVEGTFPRKRFILSDPDPKRREELILSYQLGINDEVSANDLFTAQKKLQRLLRDAGD